MKSDAAMSPNLRVLSGRANSLDTRAFNIEEAASLNGLEIRGIAKPTSSRMQVYIYKRTIFPQTLRVSFMVIRRLT
jgi:hypothetical protein